MLYADQLEYRRAVIADGHFLRTCIQNISVFIQTSFEFGQAHADIIHEHCEDNHTTSAIPQPISCTICANIVRTLVETNRTEGALDDIGDLGKYDQCDIMHTDHVYLQIMRPRRLHCDSLGR